MAYRRKDPRSRNVIKVNHPSGNVLTEGCLVKRASNGVALFTAGADCCGIAMEARATGDTSALLVDFFQGPVTLVADVGSGTPASGDFKSCDTASGAATIAVGTDSSHDFIYQYNGTADTVDCIPLHVSQNVQA